MSPDRSAGSLPLILGIAAVILLLGGWAFFRSTPSRPPDDPNRLEARRLVGTWADKLDGQTADTGVYVRWPNDELPENDPWGRPLRVEYSQGGIAEHLTVRSAGPDGVAATRHAVNLKGIGEGVKKNAEETSKNAAKGAVKGLVEGAKEALKKK